MTAQPGPAHDPRLAAAAGTDNGALLTPQEKPAPPPPKPDSTPSAQAQPVSGSRDDAGESQQALLTPVVPDVGPDDLRGLSPERVRALLGGPVSVTEEPPATVWQYRTGSCAADLFFYLDITSQELRVVTLAIRGAEDTEKARKACLADIRARNRNGGRS